MSFYNTISLSFSEHSQEILLAKKQEDFILTILNLIPDQWITPWQMQDIAVQNGKDFEITSIRRAMTDLEQQGKLIKSGKANFMGKKGKPNHAWKFNNGKLL